MSQEEQDQQIGRLVREKRAGEEYVEQLRARAASYGSVLANLGQMLRDFPEKLLPAGDALVTASRPETAFVRVKEIPSPEDVFSLVSELRSKRAELDSITERLKRLKVL